MEADPEVRKRLVAMGYVGGLAPTSADPAPDRADPKDRIAVFNRIAEARERARLGGVDAPEAAAALIALLQDVVTADPNLVEAWFLLGTHAFSLRRFDEAAGYFRKTLELRPDHDHAVTMLAGTYREMGNDAAAIAGFEYHLARSPKDADAHCELGELYLARGDLSKADELFRKALSLDRRAAQATVALGVISERRGDRAGAERFMREALTTRPDVALAHFNLALIAEARGDARTAETEYQEELKRHPDSYQAAFNLARLYQSAGRRPQQVEALKQSIAGNPRFADAHFALAKAYLDSGEHLADAIRLAQRALELDPHSPLAPVGRQVIAAAGER